MGARAKVAAKSEWCFRCEATTDHRFNTCLRCEPEPLPQLSEKELEKAGQSALFPEPPKAA